jgi:hypothetical protein
MQRSEKQIHLGKLSQIEEGDILQPQENLQDHLIRRHLDQQ